MVDLKFNDTIEYRIIPINDQDYKTSILHEPLNLLIAHNHFLNQLVKDESKGNKGKIFDSLQNKIEKQVKGNENELKNMKEELRKYLTYYESQLKDMSRQSVTFEYEKHEYLKPGFPF